LSIKPVYNECNIKITNTSNVFQETSDEDVPEEEVRPSRPKRHTATQALQWLKQAKGEDSESEVSLSGDDEFQPVGDEEDDEDEFEDIAPKTKKFKNTNGARPDNPEKEDEPFDNGADDVENAADDLMAEVMGLGDPDELE
jgi:hypothetical protein